MSRNRFREIKKYLHLNDNAKIDKSMKMYKLQKYFDQLNKNFQKFGIFSAKLSLDEMMVRYYGRHPSKMFMRGKPIKFGFKLWCLCSASGYLYNFIPYCGKSSNDSDTGPLGTRVICQLTDIIQQCERHEIYFDNFFTSVNVLSMLKNKNLKATGTVRETRTNKCPLMNSKDMLKQQERGYFDHRFDTNNEVLVVKWKDSKVVNVASNFGGLHPLGSAKRYSQKEKKVVNIPIPKLIQDYNNGMGGVDLLDKQISLYRIRIRSKKWWWPLFTQMIDITVVNAWRIYQIISGKNIPLLQFRRKIVLFYLSKNTNSAPHKRGRRSTQAAGGRVSDDIRFDPGNHLIIPIATQRRCAMCGKKTTRICGRCEVPLHDRCFAEFHAK